MESPLRSEAAMFRVLVVVAAGAVPVIAAGLVIRPLAGAIVLAVELALGVALLWRRRRGPRGAPDA